MDKLMQIALIPCILALILVCALPFFLMERGQEAGSSELFFGIDRQFEEESQRRQELDAELEKTCQVREERYTIMAELAMEHITFGEAVEGFRRLNEETPQNWKAIHVFFPTLSDEQLVCHQMLIFARNWPAPAHISGKQFQLRMQQQIRAYLNSPLPLEHS